MFYNLQSIEIKGAQSTILQLLTYHGFCPTGCDRSNKAQILFFIKIAICKALGWGVDLVTYWGTPCRYLSLGGD